MTQENNIEKARSGIYEDNSKNRRLHRVGQRYGDPKKTEDFALPEREERIDFPIGGGRSVAIENLTEVGFKGTLDRYKVTVYEHGEKIFEEVETLRGVRDVVSKYRVDAPKRDDTPLDQRTRVSFPDVPHSSKVNLKKYLSGSMRKRFDMKENFSRMKTADEAQAFHDRMIGYFEENFDKMSKADRAGWLWVIIQAKAELVKRLAAGDPNGAPIDMEEQEVTFGPEEPVIARIVEELKKNHLQMDTTQSSFDFMDLTYDAKEEVLRRVGFTGMVYREGFYGDDGSYDVRQFEDKDSIFAQIDDDTYYNDIDSDNSWTIAYSNGARIDTNDYVGEKKKIDRKNVTWAFGWGLRGYTYWAKDAAAEAEMMRELGLDKWVDGERQERNKYQENIDSLEGVFGESHPMDAKEADNKSPNPKYEQNELYRINCQSCVVAYELRRRGFDVEALPRTTDEQNRLAKNSGLAFIDPETGRTVEPRGFSGLPLGQTRGYENEFTKTNLKENFEKLTQEPGRYHFSYVFATNHKRYAHIICAERFPDGRLALYDPQSGNQIHWRDISKNMRKRFVHRVIRVDDKLINIPLMKGIVKKKGGPLQ